MAKDVFDSLAKFHSSKFEPNDIEQFIMNEIAKNKDHLKLVVEILAELYTNTTGKVIHKSQGNNIMRNRIGLHYVKTCIKKNLIQKKVNSFHLALLKLLLKL